VWSVRTRAVLSLGLAFAAATTGTLAYWTDEVTVDGTTLTTGTINLQVNGQESITGYAGLSISNMVPGNSTAAVVTVKNAGSAPLKYTIASTYTDSPPTSVGANLAALVTTATAVTGSSPTATCGGAQIQTGTSFNGTLVSTPRLLAAGATEQLCLQATLSAAAPSSLQGGSTVLNLTFTGTSF
jgi:predicted ribosomally synthesized peptide with SipW-like signal peptide